MKLTRTAQHSTIAIPEHGARWLLALAWQRIAKRRAEQLRLIEEQEAARGA